MGQTSFTYVTWISLLHTPSPYIPHFLSELIYLCLARILLMPKKLDNTESVLLSCCACEKVALSGDTLQHVHLADEKVEAAVTGQGWECRCKSPSRWGVWWGWHAKEPGVEQCLAMCIVITAFVAKFSVNSCTVLTVVLKSEASEQTPYAISMSFRNPFYMRSQEFIVN